MFFLKVGDKILPTPSYYAVDAEDIDSEDSRRSDETGKMHRRRLREGVKTCDVKWILTGSQAEELRSQLSAPVLSVELLDTKGDGYYKCSMYASGLKSVFYQQQYGMKDFSYWEISCRLIEY